MRYFQNLPMTNDQKCVSLQLEVINKLSTICNVNR